MLAIVGGAAAIAACASAPATDEMATGERAFAKCVSCHALEAGATTPAGPTLYQIVGRRIAAEPGVDYSPALERFAQRHERWTPDLLDRMIADSEALVPGTYMSFHGIADADERRALIAFLRRAANSNGT